MEQHYFLVENPLVVHDRVKNVLTIEELENALGSKQSLKGLAEVVSNINEIDFWRQLFPKLLKWLIDPLPECLPLFPSGKNKLASFSIAQVRSILANCFFLNIKSTGIDTYGDLSFSLSFSATDRIYLERTKCFINYFIREYFEENLEFPDMVIERVHVEKHSLPDWKNLENKLSTENIFVHSKRMEDCLDNNQLDVFKQSDQNITMVDFANKQIHIGWIAPSLTQEEILFSCVSECFLSLLLCEQLKDNEAVLIKNVRRSVEYKGYFLSFRVLNTIKNAPLMDVTIIDATFQNSFHSTQIIRDLNKAWIGYQHCGERISTGHWGCGAFGGNPAFKFLQQLCVASVLNKKLSYSTFMDEACKQKFNLLLEKTNGKSVAEIVNFLISYKQNCNHSKFDDYCATFFV